MDMHGPARGIWPVVCRLCGDRWPCAPGLRAIYERAGGPGHRCQCRLCHRDDFPPIPERGAPYIALSQDGIPRWASEYAGVPARYYAVEFNGSPVSPDWLITEARAGEAGWLIRTLAHTGWPHHCICNSRDWPCQRVEYGVVSLQAGRPTTRQSA